MQLEDAGSAHAAADAHGDHAVAHLAASHFLEQRCGEFGAGAAEGMAERDGAAVDVDARRIEAERADDGEGLRGKGLVELDEADVVEGEAGELEGFGDGGDGTDAHLFRQAAGDGVGDEAGEGVKAEFAGAAGIHENGGGGAVGGLRGVAGGDGSLRVEGGLELGQRFGGGVGARAFVGGEDLSP